MNCDVGEVTERLENELCCDVVKQRKGWRMSYDVGEVSERLENELILQPIFRFSYVTGFSLTSPGEPPMDRLFCSPKADTEPPHIICEPLWPAPRENYSLVSPLFRRGSKRRHPVDHESGASKGASSSVGGICIQPPDEDREYGGRLPRIL